ncbi:unnamed protein product, partial [Ranitomeya imitator]
IVNHFLFVSGLDSAHSDWRRDSRFPRNVCYRCSLCNEKMQNSGNIYINSISQQNVKEEIYVNGDEDKGKKENRAVEEDIYINGLSY